MKWPFWKKKKSKNFKKENSNNSFSKAGATENNI